jgi:O-antigen ligase
MMLVVWGVLAFGSVYPWAFVPLLVASAALGIGALVARTGRRNIERSLAVALMLLLGSIAIQLIPLPISALQSISPSTDSFLRNYEVGYPQSVASHALSVEPRATATALAATAALAILLLGLAHLLDGKDALHIVRALTILGVVVALLGIVQKALWQDKIYGFWTPIEGGNPFGPFVNKNHFAGWMLMVIPITVGYFCGRVAKGIRRSPPGWRNRLLWGASSDASESILVGFAAIVMALSLTLTMSRSGFLGLLAAVAVAVWFVVHRYAKAPRRIVAIGYLAFVVLAVIGWVGFDKLVGRFAGGDIVTLNNRVGIWTDTLSIARDFPFFGTGLNTYGVSALFYQTVMPEKHLAQAHNDYLQVVAEGGLLVGLPAAFAVFVLIRLIRERFRRVSRESTDYWIRVGAVTGITAIALQETADFSLQMPGNAVPFVLLLAIALRPLEGRA